MRRKRIGLIRGLVCALALVCAVPATAQATGIQSDWALMYDQPRFFARADQLDANWVRVMVPYNRWHNGEADTYVHAVRSAHDSGRRVLVSLMSWENYPTASQWAGFAREVVPMLAPYVDAWSPMNEPNWPGMAPYSKVSCAITTDVSTVPVVSTVRDGVRVEHRYRQSKRGHWFRKHHRWHHGRLKGHRRYRRITRRVSLTKSQTIMVRTVTERNACSAEANAVAYRKVYDAVAPILKTDTGAVIVVGDLCGGGTGEWMDAFLSAGPPAVYPDVLASHYDTPRSASQVRAYAHQHGMMFWETEWGLRGNPTAAEWLTAYAVVEKFADLLFVYDTGADTGWDTRIPDDALNLLATAR